MLTNASIDFKIQTSPTKTVKAVCYSPEKRTQLANALLTKSPVKIDQIKRKSSGDYAIRKKTKVAGLDSAALEFQYDEVLGNNLKPSRMPVQQQFMTVLTSK